MLEVALNEGRDEKKRILEILGIDIDIFWRSGWPLQDQEETMRIIILPVLIHTRGHTSTPNLSQVVALPSEQIQITANHLVQRGPLHWGLPLPTLEIPTQ